MAAGLSRTTVFYDGTCGLCHGAVQFLLKRDPNGLRFRYAALQGETAISVLESQATLPDSMVVQTRDGTLLVESSAAVAIGIRLGGAWRALAAAARLLPVPLRDWMYRLIAKHRYRWFGRKTDLCPLLPSEQRSFFLP
jgi:predicted DCC family thiol-disulfide oxidoreductase YuxK